MSLLTSINGNGPSDPFFWPYDNGPGIPGPPGAIGPAGPAGAAGPQGDSGANSFGTWLYNTNNPPAPEDLFLGPTDLVINYTAELPGGLTFLRAARNLFNSNGGTLTLSFQQEQGTFGPVSVSLLVSAITLDDILGLATLTFTYIGGAVPPFVWAVGNSVQVVAIGGAVGPTGPAGPPGGNDWYNYPALGPVDMSGQSILGLDDIAMTGDLSGATSITTSGNLNTVGVIASGPISSGSTITASGTVSGLDVSATNAVNGNSLNATTSINATTGTLTVQNANITSTANIYTDLLAGFGTLQVGSPNPLAANPGLIYLNGSLYQSRGNCNANITANGIYIDGNTIIPGAVGFEVGSIPVAGVNTCRFSVNSLTSPASIVGIAPLGITLDAGAASNFSSVGPTTISTAADIILQAANNNAFIQGGALPGDFCDLTFTHGGSIQNLGGLNGQTTGLNISNINQLSGAAGGPGAGTISVANTLQGGASVNFQTAGDVVSSLGTSNYSLNTIGAQVAFQSTKVFYVSKQGNDANPGSQLAPKLTIQAAITAAEAAPALSAANFALIIVDKGKYVESLTFTKGYTVVSGVAGSQQDLNELTELTGNVVVNITAGASDLFARQVVIENFQITGTITDTSTVNHTLTLNNGRLFGTNKLLDMSGTATEYRLRLDNYTINQSSATANTDPMIRLSGPAAPGANGCQAFIYRLNATARNNCNVIRLEGCATIAQMAQSQLESTTASATAAAIVEFAGTVGSAGLSSFGQSSFAYTNSTLKTASANSTGILISGAYTALAPKVLFVLSCFFALAGTVHPSNHIIKNVNGVANSTTVMFGAGSSAPTDNSPFLGSVRYTAVIDATNLNKLTAQTVS